jgi:hypothetical protein
MIESNKIELAPDELDLDELEMVSGGMSALMTIGGKDILISADASGYSVCVGDAGRAFVGTCTYH